MLIMSPSKATTGFNHTAVVPVLGWLAVLTLSRARIDNKVVIFVVGQQGQALALLSLLPLPSSSVSAVWA